MLYPAKCYSPDGTDTELKVGGQRRCGGIPLPQGASHPQASPEAERSSGGVFCNDIHLNVIEAAADPAMESRRDLNEIDDLVATTIRTESYLVISAATRRRAGALAAAMVLARNDVVLNPYYQHMPGPYGSEYREEHHAYSVQRDG
jgi:hypothetical protein